ncbi:hypothetical protein [Candidatus Methylobacter oryzae]|nr:hypothetical protein [Candidatus Methylobacter oryzae]
MTMITKTIISFGLLLPHNACAGENISQTKGEGEIINIGFRSLLPIAV